MLERGFNLRKFKTNDKELEKCIAEKERGMNLKEAECQQDEASYAKETLGLSKDSGGKTKILGIPSDSDNDVLEFELGTNNENKPEAAKKRGILSRQATIFDTLGLISSVLVKAKVLFQDLCKEKLNWDDKLPTDKLKSWNAWLEDMTAADTISVPRSTLCDVEGEVLSISLHGLGDASKYAYCALIFLVCHTTKGVYTKLLCAKTRVAPLKILSIPRLELMSARILVTLMETVNTALDS